jgi:SAM-dependent methyltransferase
MRQVPKAQKSASSHAILDAASRKRKADKILHVLGQKIDLAKAEVLDIGTGAGYIAHHIAGSVGSVISVDLVDERKVKAGYTFVKVQSEVLPFESGTFDVVISNHVIEHVNDQQEHVSEVLRVLKPEGLAYVATPNRNWLTDPHYRLPFINWMPRRAATLYLKVVKSARWDIRPITPRRLQTYVGKQHQLDSVVVDIVKNPKQYELDAFKRLQPLTRRLPRTLLQSLSVMSPTILVVLTKVSTSPVIRHIR